MVIDYGKIMGNVPVQGDAMQRISVSTFKATCLQVLESVRQTGTPLLITKRGEPLAQVLPPPPRTPDASWFGCMAETGKVCGDLVEPLGTDAWESLR